MSRITHSCKNSILEIYDFLVGVIIYNDVGETIVCKSFVRPKE